MGAPDTNKYSEKPPALAPEVVAANERLGTYVLRLLLWNGTYEDMGGHEPDGKLTLNFCHTERGHSWLIWADAPHRDDKEADYRNHDLEIELWGPGKAIDDQPDYNPDNPVEGYDLHRGGCAGFGLEKDGGLVTDVHTIDDIGRRLHIAAQAARLDIQEPYPDIT